MRTNPLLVAALAAVLLPACATLSPDGGLAAVDAAARARVKHELVRASTDEERARVAALVAERLARPLAAEDAVAVALLNNPGLQAAYAELGIAEAELVQAGRARNPGFSFARLERGPEREIERTFTFDLLWLVTMPMRLEAERDLFAARQSRTAVEVVRVADEARRAWIEAVAATEHARYARDVSEAAAASAELAREMARAGNFSRLAQSREQLFAAEAAAGLARTRHAEVAAHERLARALGLWGEARAFRLPERLPDPPAAPRELADAEATAIASRLDVQGAKRETEALARALGLTRATRLVNVLHLGYERNSSNEAPQQTGYEIELEIPLFDFGDARLARSEAAYMASVHRTAEVAVRARSEVRESWSAYRTAWDLARHYREEIVPLRKRISEENLLRYNGMLIGVFELLADARDQVGAVMAAIESNRDFWIAEANLETALLAGSPAGGSALRASFTPTPSAGGGH